MTDNIHELPVNMPPEGALRVTDRGHVAWLDERKHICVRHSDPRSGPVHTFTSVAELANIFRVENDTTLGTLLAMKEAA